MVVLVPPNHPFFGGVFHYFHHPFWENPYYWKHPYIFRWALYKFWGWLKKIKPLQSLELSEISNLWGSIHWVTGQSINDTWAFFQRNKNFQELPGTHASRRESMTKWPWPMCFWIWRLLRLLCFWIWRLLRLLCFWIWRLLRLLCFWIWRLRGLYVAASPMQVSCRCWPTPQIRGVIPEGRFGHTHRFSTVVERLDSQKHCMLGLQWSTFTFYSLFNLDLLTVRSYLWPFSPWQGVRCFFVEPSKIRFFGFWCRLLLFVFWSS